MSATEGVVREWQSTGQKVHIEPGGFASRIPDYDQKSGKHYWVVATIYKVNAENFSDPTATPHLDGENLASIAGPFCYHCEQPYRKQLGKRRCEGPPPGLSRR